MLIKSPSLYILVVFACSWLSGLVFAETKKEIEIGVSFSIPPWVIQETDTGIEIDLLRLAFEESPYSPKVEYLPFSRVHMLFDHGGLDGYINAKPNPDKGGYLSDTVVTFQNVAVSLASKEFPEEITIEFLRDKQIAAFQKANLLLGDEFAAMANKNPYYQELAKQELQLNLLFVRNIDFIVLDKSIFGYFWKRVSENQLLNKEGYRYDKAIVFHQLFAPSDYAYRFKDKAVRDAFNAGLARIRENGQYDEVIKRYDHLSDLYDKIRN